MKIGILTFHRAVNYGAILQAYALQRTILELGYEVEIIDYQNEIIKKSDDTFNLKKITSIRSLISMCVYYPLRKKRKRIFNEFIDERLILSAKKFKNENMITTNDIYDMFIVGSDQVWNYDITGKDSTYFLNFVRGNKKKASYAASLGYSEIPQEYISQYKNHLNDFHLISVRENQGAKVLRRLVNQEVYVTLDPTLLLNKEQWKEFALNTENKEKDYILLYVMSISHSIFRFAEKLSKLTGCKIIFITDSYKNRVQAECLRDANPYEFVSLFANAKYVVTNSFHGLAFAINLNKEFYVELLPPPSKVNSRLLNIIELLDLEERIISNKGVLPQGTNIDWNRINEKLDSLRKDSIDYLEKIIK